MYEFRFPVNFQISPFDYLMARIFKVCQGMLALKEQCIHPTINELMSSRSLKVETTVRKVFRLDLPSSFPSPIRIG